MRVLVLVLCVLGFWGRVLAADSTFVPQVHPCLEVSRCTSSIKIDGEINEDAWKCCNKASHFTAAMPIPGTRPPVETDAYLTYDDNYLYVAMIAHDPNPKEIQAPLVPRDRIFDGDFMGIILDTYGDASRAFELYVNPRGIQGDLFWSSNGNEDGSYDMVFESEAKITDSGWQMEMKIPFRSLRFPDKPVQNFHCCFWRSYPRDVVYKSGWSSINLFIPCAFCQLGSITGIHDIHPSGALELLPAVVASESGSIADGETHFKNDPLKVSPSLGIRYSLGTATALEAAINPDFSQVEADAPQISANNTFALFYPEHRPFFQDGSDLLNTSIPVVYTRSINSPIVAGKVIHRDALNSIAYIGAADENSPIILPLEEKSIIVSDAGKSISNILRATHSFGDNFYIGAMATDRRYSHNGSNTVLGVDGRIQFLENVEFIMQGLYSMTKEQNDSALVTDTDRFDKAMHTAAYDGEYYTGTKLFASLQRFTPGLDVQLNYGETTPSFRAGNGYIFTNATRALFNFTGYKFPLETRPAFFQWLIEIDGSISLYESWNFDSWVKQRYVKPEIDLSLVGQTNLHFYYQPTYERFHNVNFPHLYTWNVNGETRPFEWMTFGGSVNIGKGIARFLDVPEQGKTTDLSFYARFKPWAGLLVEPSYSFSQLDSESGSGHYYSGAVYRTEFTYQFTRSLDLRLIVQYDGFAGIFEFDPLLTYRINPFSSFFIGSTHNYLTPLDSFSPKPTERHFFAKIQYLFQS